MMEYKHIRLIDASDCTVCRFAESTVIEVNGRRIPTLRCKRLDCDNWITNDAYPAEETQEGFRRL